MEDERDYCCWCGAGHFEEHRPDCPESPMALPDDFVDPDEDDDELFDDAAYWREQDDDEA